MRRPGSCMVPVRRPGPWGYFWRAPAMTSRLLRPLALLPILAFGCQGLEPAGPHPAEASSSSAKIATAPDFGLETEAQPDSGLLAAFAALADRSDSPLAVQWSGTT